MIDLMPFCGRDFYREYISKPFSRGEFTYAANGIICVRVARREDAPEQQNYAKPNILALPWDQLNGDFMPLPEISLPPATIETKECDCYEGKEHDCPNCECECETCDGTGKITIDSDDNKSVGLLGLPFAMSRVRLMMSLPDVQIRKVQFSDLLSPAAAPFEILGFRFDGGDGLLMPLRNPRKEHIEIDRAAIAKSEGRET